MSSEHDILIKKTARLTRRAQIYLFWEQYSPVFAKAAAMLALFLIGSFSGLWQWLGDPFRLVLLLAAIVYLILAFRKAAGQKSPSRSAAMRRVEQDSNSLHRPLDTLQDRPAITDAGWDRHYAKAEKAAEQLKPPKLRPVLAGMDKYYLRFAIPAILALSLFMGASDNFERLRHSLTPGWLSGSYGDDITFEAWVDPPAYTGRPPIYFKNTTHVEVPAGSELVARVIGTKDPTRLKLRGEGLARHLPLTRIGPDSYEARTILKESKTASWRIGETRKSWRITALDDHPPTVSFVQKPEADKRDRLTFSYALSDDYGVEKLTLLLTLLQDDPEAGELTRKVNVPLGGRIRKTEDKSSALDLTKHEWAGQKVLAVLLAEDGLGQTARTGAVYFTVPDKIFIEPLAKAVIEHRRLVMTGQDEANKTYAPLPKLTRQQWRNRPWFDTYEPEFRLERAPKSIARAVVLIDAVTDRPEDLFHDPAVFMGLRNVASRLRYAQEADALTGIPDELWNIAIRAEFGTLGTALEEMREAEAALRDGMARRAPQREIDTLFERYNEAVDRYREELLRKAIEEGNMAQGGGGEGGSSVDMDQIQALLDAIEEANRLGDTEGARRALAQLADLLENMQIQLAQGGGGSGQSMPGEMSEEMKEALEDLADLLGEQRELKDDTQQAERAQNEEQNGNEAGQQPGAGDQQGPQTGDGQEEGQGQSGRQPLSPEQLAEAQGRLQELLDKAEGVLPEPGDEEGSAAGGSSEEDGEDGAGGINTEEAIDDARRAMELAQQALERGELGQAQDEQADAIAALREAGRGLAEQARRELEGSSPEEAMNGEGDPLGREDGGTMPNDQSEADIDSRDNATRSRELQDEIRRRAAEQERKKDEREYLERLLKRF